MKLDYLPSLRLRGAPELLCGHTDCCYYTSATDSCDYMLIESRPRGCPPRPDCPHYAPAGRLRGGGSIALAARIQACLDAGWSYRRIARSLHICESALRRLRAQEALRSGRAGDSDIFHEKAE